MADADFGPKKIDRVWPTLIDRLRLWPKLVFCSFGPTIPPQGRGRPPPKGGAPKGGGPKISRFFPLPPQFSFFLPLLGVLSWNFGGV